MRPSEIWGQLALPLERGIRYTNKERTKNLRAIKRRCENLKLAEDTDPARWITRNFVEGRYITLENFGNHLVSLDVQEDPSRKRKHEEKFLCVEGVMIRLLEYLGSTQFIENVAVSS